MKEAVITAPLVFFNFLYGFTLYVKDMYRQIVLVLKPQTNPELENVSFRVYTSSIFKQCMKIIVQH